MLEDISRYKAQHLAGVDEMITDNHASTFLGRWYDLNGHAAQARLYLVPYVQRAVFSNGKFRDILEEYNMYYAFAHVLLGKGDHNVIAIFHSSHLQLAWLCAGRCGRKGSDWTGITVCRYCTAELCSDCAQQLDEGKRLQINGVCRPEHIRLHIPTVAKSPGPGEFCVGEEIMSSKEFNARIRRQWDLD
jgi:hypothetical protein